MYINVQISYCAIQIVFKLFTCLNKTCDASSLLIQEMWPVFKQHALDMQKQRFAQGEWGSLQVCAVGISLIYNKYIRILAAAYCIYFRNIKLSLWINL